MDEQELDKIRAEALSCCRKLCQAEAQNNEVLVARSIVKLLGSAELAEQIFVLSDHENKGVIATEAFVQLFKYNLG